MGYDGSLKFDTEISEKGFNKGIKNLGNIAQGGISWICCGNCCRIWSNDKICTGFVCELRAEYRWS